MTEKKESTLLKWLDKHVTSPLKELFSKSKEKQQYADVIIKNQEGKILLLHRVYGDDFMAGKWGFPGGKIEQGETAEQGAIREAFEETGIQLNGVRAIDVQEKDDCVIHYFEALLTDTNTYTDIKPLSSDVILDTEEHRGYEWVEQGKIQEYDLIADLNSYVDALLGKTFPITVVKRKFSNPEEQIAMIGGGVSLDQAWEVLQKAFDNDQISEEAYLKARNQYLNAKKKEAIELVQKAFDLDMISEEQYMEVIQKSK